MRRALLGLVAVALLAACGGDEEVVSPYDRSPVPAVPDRTADVVDTDPLPDGQYWAPTVVTTGDGALLQFDLAQAFFGPVCSEVLGADACDGDMGVLADPTRTVTVDPVGTSPISVAASNGQNYAVPAEELLLLVGGGAPSATAPEGYEYNPYPFLLTFRDGRIAGIQQIWMP